MPKVFEKDLFARLNPEIFDAIRQKSVILNLDENVNILVPGQCQKYLYWIRKGIVRCYIKASESEWTNWFASEGDLACSIESFFEEAPSEEYIETCTPVTVYQVSKQDCLKLLGDYPQLYEFAFQHAQNRLLRSERRRHGLHLLTAYQRYEQFLETHSFIANRVKMNHIASYLGITPTHLSRVRKEFALKGRLRMSEN